MSITSWPDRLSSGNLAFGVPTKKRWNRNRKHECDNPECWSNVCAIRLFQKVVLCKETDYPASAGYDEAIDIKRLFEIRTGRLQNFVIVPVADERKTTSIFTTYLNDPIAANWE